MTANSLCAALLSLLLLAPAAAAADARAGAARVWFLRQYESAESLATPLISANAAPLALSRPGTAFFRNFAPGAYTFTVASYGMDAGQAQSLRLAAGDEVYLEVQSLSSWTTGCDYASDTFYVRQLTPEWAKRYLPQMTVLGGQ